MMSVSDSYNHKHNALALYNCSISVVHDLFQVLLHLGLVCTPRIWCAPFLHPSLGAAFQTEPYRQEFYPSLAHNFYMSAHHVLLIYRNYRTIVAMFMCTSAMDDSFPQHAFLLFEKSHPTEQASRSVLFSLMVLLELALLTQVNLRTLGSGTCHDLAPYISCTTPLHVLMVQLSCLVLGSAFLGKSFSIARGFVELLNQDLTLGSHAASSRSINIQPMFSISTTSTHS